MKWTVREQGANAVIDVWREDDGTGLFQVFIVGNRSTCLLGTLAPEVGGLHLRRTLPVERLREKGCWPVQTIREEMICSFQQPEIRWEDAVLRRSARSLPRYRLQREKNGFSMSFAFDSHAPFPLTPAFCFARLAGERLIFSFHANGVPYVPEK